MSPSQSARRVLITGIGLVSSLADEAAGFHRALLAGESGIGPLSLFDTEKLGSCVAGEVRDFDPQQYLGRANLRPVDRAARLVIVAAHQAFAASGWTPEMREAHDVGLVLGTMFGSIHTISAFDRRALTAGPKYAKPFDFANSVINAAAGQTAIWHSLRGINSTVAGGSAAGLQALAYATEAIRTGRADALLAGGADELCFESFFGFRQAGMLAMNGDGSPACSVPFDARRNGFVVGEGAGLLMLEAAESALARGAPILGEIRGHANCYDCSRGRDERAAEAVQSAIRLALEDAGIDPQDIGAVSAAGNGSIAGDRFEARGLAGVFEGSAEPPITAVKSLLGETLGASGAFATIALLESLANGVLPGVRGLGEIEDGLGLRRLSAASTRIDARYGLVDAIGLDGNVAALVLERTNAKEMAGKLGAS
ncbi:MAG: beta-ketoacyl-[acyl-carrier-protein] synthase family protein [Acidobacteriota bacterium]